MSALLKETIKEMFATGIDGITFFPHKDGDFGVELGGFSFNKKHKYDTNHLGHVYHIMLCKTDEDGIILNPDRFESTLTDPYVYVSNIISCGFYGIVMKKTNKSKKIANELFKQFVQK